MITRVAHIALLSLCIVSPCLGEALEGVKTISTKEQVNEWIMHYYEHPRPDLAKSALAFCDKNGYFAVKKVETPSVYFVYEEILRANPTIKSDFLSAAAQGTLDLKRAVAFALWFSRVGTKQDLDSLAKGALAPYIAELSSQERFDLLSTQQISPTILDAFWAAFFATGDERYVERVAGYVPWVQEKQDVGKLLIGGAARWSLTSNAIQDAKVLAIAKRLAGEAAGPRREILESIVTQAEKERAR